MQRQHTKSTFCSPRRGGRNPQQRADRARCMYAQVCGVALGCVLGLIILAANGMNPHVAHTLELVCAGTFVFFAARWHRVNRQMASVARPPRFR